MALACTHPGVCTPGCRNYEARWAWLERQTRQRLEGARAAIQECRQVLDLIETARQKEPSVEVNEDG